MVHITFMGKELVVYLTVLGVVSIFLEGSKFHSETQTSPEEGFDEKSPFLDLNLNAEQQKRRHIQLMGASAVSGSMSSLNSYNNLHSLSAISERHSDEEEEEEESDKKNEQQLESYNNNQNDNRHVESLGKRISASKFRFYKAMKKVEIYTKYFPRQWKSSNDSVPCSSEHVYKQFTENIYPTKLSALVQDFWAILVSPYTIGVQMANHTQELIQFSKTYTETSLGGVTNICTGGEMIRSNIFTHSSYEEDEQYQSEYYNNNLREENKNGNTNNTKTQDVKKILTIDPEKNEYL